MESEYRVPFHTNKYGGTDFHGMDVREVLKTEEGKKWVINFIKKPVKDNEFKEKNLSRNKLWAGLIDAYETPTVAKAVTEFGGSVEKVESNVGKTMIENQNIMIELLETLVKNTARMETEISEEPVWDD